MKHFGDITKISGYEVPVVDCVIGGSPCQDLSIAGKRAGLAGERSGLYMEQIRIIKEMREADVLRGRTAEFIRPRYMVWENVPGAFSSNGGKDFAAVIEEIIKICEPDADVQVCVPDKGWTKSGCYYSDDGRWSIAWRVHDAQFWGVPQRRKRIALVADFGGLSAPEILFERKGVHWNSEPGRKARQATAAGTEGSIDSAIALQGNGIDRAETAGCNGAGWRRGGVTPSTPLTDTVSAISFQERAGKPGGVKEYLSNQSELER
jgi:DNA (cytosine-5)-methyltransferase 1